MALRKTLPKDLGDMIDQAAESGDYRDVHAALERCEVNACTDLKKGTVLMMRECTPELARWAVERGTDVNAQDRYGETALHQSAFARFNFKLTPSDLIALGADVHAQFPPRNQTALHKATEGKNLASVEVLLVHGIDVQAVNDKELTALEAGLQRMQNTDLVDMVPVVQALLAAGAQVTPTAQELMRKAGENFEFMRDKFNPDRVDEASAALSALYELVGAAPVAARIQHDGVSPIRATGATWQDQHEELWQLLVPGSGPCLTVQGEVIRISGRINHEIHGNGAINWDDGFRAMAQALGSYMGTGVALPEANAAWLGGAVQTLPNCDDATTNMLAELAVYWVACNPQPIPLGPTPYER